MVKGLRGVFLPHVYTVYEWRVCSTEWRNVTEGPSLSRIAGAPEVGPLHHCPSTANTRVLVFLPDFTTGGERRRGTKARLP